MFWLDRPGLVEVVSQPNDEQGRQGTNRRASRGDEGDMRATLSGQEPIFKGLSAAQKRHLRELHGDGSRTLYWRPANSGEERCAEVLHRKGLIEGSFVSYSDAYYLSSEGKRIARALAEAGDV